MVSYLLDICIHFLLLDNKLSQNYHLKTTCILSSHSFCGSGVQAQPNGLLAQCLTKLKSRCRLVWISFWSGIFFQAHVVVGRIRCLEVVGLESHSLAGCHPGTLLGS